MLCYKFHLKLFNLAILMRRLDAASFPFRIDGGRI